MSPLATGLVVSVATTAAVLWVVERLAPVLGLMDVPNARSSHSRPTPRGGGIAIVLGSLLGLVVSLVMQGSAVPPTSVLVLAAAGLVALVSLVDDLRSLSPVIRILTHATAAAAIVGRLPLPAVVDLPGIGLMPTGPAAPAIAVLWIVAVTNIYNFMDGIDGLAGGQGLVAGAVWGVVGLVTGDGFLAASGFAIAASCAIFLSRNWTPAHIFMGDAGSAFLGFLFAVLPLVAVGEPLGARAWPLGVIVLWPFLFDATLTLVRRLGRGENVLKAHRSHLYQRLVVGGATHAWVSGMYTVLVGLMALAGLAWVQGRLPGWGVVSAALAESAVLVLVVRRWEQ